MRESQVHDQQTITLSGLATGMDEQNEIESVEEQIKPEDGQEEPSLGLSLRSVPLQRPAFDIKSLRQSITATKTL